MKNRIMMYEADATQEEREDWQASHRRYQEAYRDLAEVHRIAKADAPLSIEEQKTYARRARAYEVQLEIWEGAMNSVERAISNRKWPVLYPR